MRRVVQGVHRGVQEGRGLTYRTYLKALSIAAAIALIVIANLGVLDQAGARYAEDGLKRALIAYGVARGLNGVISVAQGTEVAVEPAGVGVTFKPGEILDPLNDLIERFSWILLISGTSLGIQRVLLNVASATSFTIFVSVVVLAWVCVIWRPRSVPDPIRAFVRGAALVLLVARFAIPVAALASEALYQAFLEPQYTESTRKLDETAATIKRASDEPEQPGPREPASILDTALRAYRSARDAVDIQERIDVLGEAAADVGEYTIDLIVVFVLETIVFPLLFLWLALQLARRLLRAEARPSAP